jgi:preprotein translocase subunit SecA
MSKETTIDANIWERLTDGLSVFGEGVGRWLTRLMGSSNERYIRKLGYIRAKSGEATHTVIPGSLLAQVNDLEPKMQALSDEELRGSTARFREQLAKGETLEDLLPEAFAACREAAKRTKNMRHFDVQILGGIVLHRGNIAEMVTGEGKTLVATLPAFLNGLEGKGVHVVTVNDYLARRDCEWMLPIYRAVGMSAGFIQSDMDPVARRAAYDCDITYGTNSEFGFDYLRDNMKPARWGDPQFDPHFHQCQKSLNYAIIDEVDNILIDEARTPLIISGAAFSDVRRFAKANEVAVQLSELQKNEPNKYFEIKEKGADLPPDRRGHPQGRGAGRRRELLHRRQHGVAAPD